MSDGVMPFEKWIFCGTCEEILDYIPFDGKRITTDGLLMIQEAGWKHNGVAWECADCLRAAQETSECTHPIDDDLWSPTNPWGHVPEDCGTADCPGCYAEAYRPPDHRGHDTDHATEEDAAEVEKFRSFLRRAKEGPQGNARTYGDLYDEMYTKQENEG